MVIGILQFELWIHEAQSLKDKRQTVRSLRDSLGCLHQIGIAEIADMDMLNHAVLGVCTISNDGAHAGSVLDQIQTKLYKLSLAEVGSIKRKILHISDFESSDQPYSSDSELEDELAARALSILAADPSSLQQSEVKDS